jgi:hypothetical protein
MTSVYSHVKDLKEAYKKLTDFEALQIAVGMQYNDLFASANCVGGDGSYPSNLEAIAMSFGAASKGQHWHTIPEAISGLGITDALESIAEAIKDYGELVK